MNEQELKPDAMHRKFYCADWNRCGSICEEQCYACNKAENMPDIPRDAPQDLRERAEELLLETDMGSLYRNNQWLYESKDAVNAMLQFASEVSAGKDKEIHKLKSQISTLERFRIEDASSAQDDQIAIYEQLQKCKQRIAELEAMLNELCLLNNAEMEGLSSPSQVQWFDAYMKAEGILQNNRQ